MTGKPEYPDHLSLKWGTLKGWRIASEAGQAALVEFFELGVPASALTHHPTERQKELLCVLIDECQGEIWNDWNGKIMSKEEAKEYVLDYK